MGRKQCPLLPHFWCHRQLNDNICIYIYILYFILTPDPGIISREMVVNLVNICTQIFENLVDDVLFCFNQLWRDPDPGYGWDSEAGIICIFADTMSRKYKIYLSGQSPSRPGLRGRANQRPAHGSRDLSRPIRGLHLARASGDGWQGHHLDCHGPAPHPAPSITLPSASAAHGDILWTKCDQKYW